ncbi:MAG: phosphatase PAP2 family protein [Ignavibacteria bacterium]|nr:phosphatase PAP2 family protein [Ignavibacteria bacterium]
MANSRLRNHIVVLACGTLACIASIVWIDAPLAYFIEQNQTSVSRQIGHWLEEAGKSHWVLIYCAIVVVAAWRSWRTVAHNHIVLFAAVAASGIIANVMKVIISRSRPHLLITDGIAAFDFFAFRFDYLWNSFPSGHATTGIAIAVAGSVAYPKLRIVMWSIGLAIAFGRIVYNVHYLSDVIGGIIIGLIISWLCIDLMVLAPRVRR